MFVRGQSQTKKLVRRLQGLTKSGSKVRSSASTIVECVNEVLNGCEVLTWLIIFNPYVAASSVMSNPRVTHTQQGTEFG